MPVQATRPITLSNNSVIQLEEPTGMEVLNVDKTGQKFSFIPLTVEQMDVGMKHDLTGSIPMQTEAVRANKVVVLVEPLGYKNMDIRPASFKQIEIPKCLEDAGEQCDKKLLNPAQRREILEFEKRKRAADEILRTATIARDNTRKIVTGQQFHRGILMCDSSDNESSEIYGEKAKEAHREAAYKNITHLERTSNIAVRTSSMKTNGNILIPETLAPRVKIREDFQTKGGTTHAFSFDETHNRIFDRRMETAPEAARTQHIRDEDLSGKTYDIVKHTLVEHWPSKTFERDFDKRLSHASQNTLEGQRNLQGSLNLRSRPF